MKKQKQKANINNHVINVITPIGLEFHPSDFWFGDQLARVLLITNYPSRVNIGWLSQIANMEGVTCSIHMEPSNPTKLIENISKSMGELAGRLNNGGSAIMMQRTEQQYKDASTLLQKIDQEQENVFYVTVAIMVLARDKEELEQKSKRVEAKIAGARMKGRVAMFKQEEALNAVSPYCINPTEIKEIASRNMPISTIAGSFPFNSSGLNDGTGYILGKDRKGGIILIDPWLRGGDRTNSNWTIFGEPGVGKSTAVKHIFANEYALGSKIIIIDPEREYKDMCEKLGGQWVNCGGGSGGRINPLQIKVVPTDDDDDEPLYKDEGKGMGALALHFQSLRTFFKLNIRGMDDIEQAFLEEELEELYAEHGITWETDITHFTNEQYPILEDLYNQIGKNKQIKPETEMMKGKYEKLYALLRRLAIGADAALWNGHTTLTADADFIVLDTHNLQDADDTIKRAQYFNILTWTWNQISQDRSEKVLLGVDEAYLMVDPEVPQTLQFMRNVSKRVRKYMGGLIIITHSCRDLLDPAVRRFGQALIDNPCYKFFMGTDGKNLEELSNLMNLTEAEQEMLAKKKRGEGLLIAGAKRIHTIIELAEHEVSLFGDSGGK